MSGYEAASRICSGIFKLSEEYGNDGRKELSDALLTIAIALDSLIRDGEFGNEEEV